MHIDYEKAAQFVQSVGIPFACLLIFAGPFIWLAFSFVRKYGPRIADAHIAFMDSATRTQEQNADTFAKLEKTAAADQQQHYSTHHAIGLVAQAGLATLDGDHEAARRKLQKVEIVLEKRETA
jgi:hypothetical protein